MAKWKVFTAEGAAPESEGDSQPVRLQIRKMPKQAGMSLMSPIEDRKYGLFWKAIPTMTMNRTLWERRT